MLLRYRQVAIMILTLLLSVTFGRISRATMPANNESPIAVVKERNEKVKEILQSKGDKLTAEEKAELKDVINGFIDFRELSKRALGKYWDERTQQEKNEFVEVFKQLIRNSSIKKLEIYKADRMEYEEPEINGTKTKVTTIAHKDRKQAEIVYHMHQIDGEWKVYDIEIDGLSTARNYRDSFYKEIAKSSYKTMYNKLVDKLEKEQQES